MGSTRAAAAQDSEHPAADAAAKLQRGRLHELPGQRRALLRRTGGERRHRHFPRVRLAELGREHARRDGRRDRIRRGMRRYDLLQRQHARRRCEVRPRVLPEDGGGPGAGRRAHPRHQGHGRRLPTRGDPDAGQSAARAVGTAGALPHSRHQRHSGRDRHGGARGRRGRGRRRGRLDERTDVTAQPELDHRDGRGHRTQRRHRPRGAVRGVALLGNRAPVLCRLRERYPLRDRRRISPRDAGRAIHEPARAGARARHRARVAEGRGNLRRGQRDVRRYHQGDPVVQGRRRHGGVHGHERAERGRRHGPGLRDRLPRVRRRLLPRRTRPALWRLPASAAGERCSRARRRSTAGPARRCRR